MFNSKVNGSNPEYPSYSSIFKNKSNPGPQECWRDFETCWDQHYVEPGKNLTTVDPKDLETTGWFSIWHCIQPFLFTSIVFLSMNYRKMNRCLKIPESPDCLKNYCCCFPFQVLWKLGYLLCSLISVVPIPALTNIYMFYLNVRSHHARSHWDFGTQMESIEGEIQKYEALGTLERINS